jgi:uncharacterized membrane protein
MSNDFKLTGLILYVLGIGFLVLQTVNQSSWAALSVLVLAILLCKTQLDLLDLKEKIEGE